MLIKNGVKNYLMVIGMGAWKELDTNIEVKVDTKELEDKQHLPFLDSYGGFTDYVKFMEKCLDATVTGSRKAAKEIAVRDRSFQQQFIRDVCDNPSGMLATSITEIQKGEYKWLIGTTINHIYPMSLEYGRKGFSAKDADALAFYYNGELIFRKSVGPAEPRPFVAPAFKKVSSIANEIVATEIDTALKNMGCK